MEQTSDKLKFVGHRKPVTNGEATTLVEIYEQIARDYPKADTLNYKREGRWYSISAATMLQRAKRIALGLYSVGVRRADREALLSEGCAEWPLADRGRI